LRAIERGRRLQAFSRRFQPDCLGDNTTGSKTNNGDERRKQCTEAGQSNTGPGGRRNFMLLPEAGIKGNSHMMMMDRKQSIIADQVIGWPDRKSRGCNDVRVMILG